MKRLLPTKIGTWAVGGILLASAWSRELPAQQWQTRSGSNADGQAQSSASSGSSTSSSGWQPRFRAATPNANLVGHAAPVEEDQAAAPQLVSPQQNQPAEDELQPVPDPVVNDPPPIPQAQPARAIRAGGDYTPEWQRKPRTKTNARRVSHQDLHMPMRTAWQSAPAGVGPGEQVPMGPGELPATAPGQPRPFVEDEVVPQPQPDAASDGEISFDQGDTFGACSQCGGGPCGPDGLCAGCGADPMACERFHVCSPLSFLNELSILLGTQSFKGPLDLGRNGNFGFHEGLNFGDALWHHKGLGYQFGAQYVESDFYGNQANPAIPTTSTRRQAFVTAGLFHRAYYGYGWQGGVVVDYLNDNYYTDFNLYQLRGEVSFVGWDGNEFGAWGTVHGSSQSRNFSAPGFPPSMQAVQSINMLSAFYRKTMRNGGQVRIWAGGTSPLTAGALPAQTAVMFGADFRVAFSNRFDLVGNFNYLAPTQSGFVGQDSGAWGMMMNLVYYPARFARGRHNGPYRPLFNVADNTTFIVDNRTP